MVVRFPYSCLHFFRQVFDDLRTHVAPPIANAHPERGRRWERWWGWRWWGRWERWWSRKFVDLRFDYLRFPRLPH